MKSKLIPAPKEPPPRPRGSMSGKDGRHSPTSTASSSDSRSMTSRRETAAFMLPAFLARRTVVPGLARPVGSATSWASNASRPSPNSGKRAAARSRRQRIHVGDTSRE